MKKFTLSIDNFIGGFAPAWFNSNYPSYGNRNMAGDMQNVDLTDPAGITQGPGLTSIDPNSTIDTLISNILDYAVSSGRTFGIGGDKFYELTPVSAGTASTPALPHTITGTSVSAQDIVIYEGWVYYSYQTSVSANVGRYNTLRTAEIDFDDDWATVSGSAHICASCPIPLCNGGNARLYIGSADRLSSFVGSTATYNEDIVEIPADSEIQDLVWNEDRLFISANRITTSGFYLGQLHTGGDLFLIGANGPSTLVTSTDYVLKKEIQLGIGGTYNVNTRAHRWYESAGSVYLALAKNATAAADVAGDKLLESFNFSTTSYNVYSDEILDAGDKIQLWIKVGASTSGYADNLDLYVGEYYTGEPPATETVDL